MSDPRKGTRKKVQGLAGNLASTQDVNGIVRIVPTHAEPVADAAPAHVRHATVIIARTRTERNSFHVEMLSGFPKELQAVNQTLQTGLGGKFFACHLICGLILVNFVCFLPVPDPNGIGTILVGTLVFGYDLVQWLVIILPSFSKYLLGNLIHASGPRP